MDKQEGVDQAQHLTIGCHLSVSKGYLAMAKNAVSIDADTFQFFTRNPRGGKAKGINPLDIAVFHEYAKHHDIRKILAHAPYTLNPASPNDEVRDFAFEIFADDLIRMEYMPHQCYNFHPGSHGKQGVEVGIEKVAEVLNAVLKPEQTTTVLLETMSGKGTEIGGRFEELAEIIKRVELTDHVGVCLDTCHIWDAGYDIRENREGVLEEFDRIIGLNRLRAIHINDSVNECGAKKDRHALIGEGNIGMEALSAFTRHPALRSLPFYLETPTELLGHKEEIARLRAAFY